VTASIDLKQADKLKCPFHKKATLPIETDKAANKAKENLISVNKKSRYSYVYVQMQ
jgi:hypothetical protein